jgi:hypothetical protein
MALLASVGAIAWFFGHAGAKGADGTVFGVMALAFAFDVLAIVVEVSRRGGLDAGAVVLVPDSPFERLARRVGFASVAPRPRSDEHARIEGTLGAHAASVTLVGDGPGPRFVRFTIAVPSAPFEEKCVLTAPRKGDAARVAASESARQAIARAFDEYHVTRFEVGGGELSALVPHERVPEVDPAALLTLLERVAPSFERVPLRVSVLGGERPALVSGSSPRCSYCHADVTGAEPDLVACGSCRTILHEGCWAELGHCPVLGCIGKEPERGPASNRERG